MTGTRFLLTSALVIAGAQWMLACSALAQESAAPAEDQAPTPTTGTRAQIEDIVVTARKRTESVQNVPLAVTAFSQKELARYNLQDIRAIASLTPSLLVERTGTNTGVLLYLRGVGSASTSVAFDQAVSINVDGMQISKGRAIYQSQLDMAQVEVLKGPQALFFGKNSPGGVISIHTANPTHKFEASLTSGYEFNSGQIYVDGYVSGPLTDTLSARVAVRGAVMTDGYYTNTMPAVPGGYRQRQLDGSFKFLDIPAPSERNMPGVREFNSRVTLAWEPTSRFNANFKFGLTRYSDRGYGVQVSAACPPGATSPQVAQGMPSPVADCKLDSKAPVASALPKALLDPSRWPLFKIGNGDPFSTYNSIISSLTLNYDLADDIVATSVTGYYNYHNRVLSNPLGPSPILLGESQDYHNITQEIRVTSSFSSPVNFTFGGYYDNNNLSFINEGVIAAIAPIPGQQIPNYNNVTGSKGHSESVFGQLIWRPFDTIEVTAGGRYSDETKNGFKYVPYVPPLQAASTNTTRFAGKFKDNNFSPEVSVSWKPSSEIMVYGAYKTGYKSGGFNVSGGSAPTTTNQSLIFGSERASGFEIGEKATLLNHTLRFDLSAYRFVYKNLQVAIFDPVAVAINTANAGKFVTKGIDLDMQYVTPVEGLTLRAAINYNSAKWKDFISACYTGQSVAEGCNLNFAAGAFNSQSLSGRQKSQAPKLSATAGFTFERPLIDGWKWQLSSDLKYTSQYYWQETLDPYQKTNGYVTINAAVQLHSDDNLWRMSVIGRNLTNKIIVLGASDRTFTGSGTGTATAVLPDATAYLNRPREVAIEITRRF